MTEDKRKQRGNIAKDKIIEASQKIIAAEGTKGLSTGKISKETGISKGNIFHHFATVEDIYDSVFDSLLQKMTLSGFSEISTVEQLFAMLGYAAFPQEEAELTSYRALMAFYNEAVYSKNYSSKIIKLKDDFGVSLKEAIKNLTQKEVPDDLVNMISIDLDGLGLYFLLENDREKYLKLWEAKSAIYIKEIMSL